MKLEKFMLIAPIVVMLLSYVAAYVVVSYVMPFALLAFKDGLIVLMGGACMLSLIVFKKEKMGWNWTTMIWFLFVVIYTIVAACIVDPMAWGLMFYIIMMPFISDNIPARSLFRKFDITKL